MSGALTAIERSREYEARTELPRHSTAARPSSAFLDWALERIRHDFGSPAASIVDVRPVPSRTALVFRMTATAGGDTRAFFLKCFEPAMPAADLQERRDRMVAIGGAVGASPILTACRVVGCSLPLRALLTAEVPGRSLLSIHHDLSRAFGLRSRAAALQGWLGLGTWLGLVHWHTRGRSESATRVRELADYTDVRLAEWASIDRARSREATEARETVAFLARTASRPVTMTLCHGDVSTGNVLVGARTGVIDTDDARDDMPAVDVSHALLEMREYGFVASVLPMAGFAAQAADAFLAGYGRPVPTGVEFWLPHLRNLSVQLLTLAARCRHANVSRFTEEAHYRRTIRELTRTIRAVRASDGTASYWLCGRRQP